MLLSRCSVFKRAPLQNDLPQSNGVSFGARPLSYSKISDNRLINFVTPPCSVSRQPRRLLSRTRHRTELRVARDEADDKPSPRGVYDKETAESRRRGPEMTLEDIINGDPGDILHAIKLADIVAYLVDNWGWEYMATEVNIKCFHSFPSVSSSLKFLRNSKHSWAREEVEDLFVFCKREEAAARLSGEWGLYEFLDGGWHKKEEATREIRRRE
ncbi:hypothetical protein CYMTET_37736 [Cymbomonas tetramitiformis]|uniref:Uncharacterized protein n=1 Tax=Cymbomonas tetramitiformis TaxID=36881 RepID=A0AAE0CF42_9CHLO|nr:hypothetical protein CYMTET_37736 [Cymbomonas tetramitiformis]